MAGTLYLCATPIGNLEDITYRVVRTLREADLIAAEDTRNSIRLLNHFDIHTPMTSYHQYNRIDKAYALVKELKSGRDVALITDAGMPGISDPGEDLVRICLEEGIRVSALPGACAAVTALPMSGLPTRRFCFEAFLPADKKERNLILEELKTQERTIVLYEAPHHLKDTLAQLRQVLGETRRISLCRELTKIHESVFRGTLQEACAYCDAQEPRGEYVLVLEGADRKQLQEEEKRDWLQLSIPEHMQVYEKAGMDRKAAMKAVAADRGISRRDVYSALLHD